MASYHRIALAGATGNLGPSILAALIDAGFDVTVLTRSSSKANLPPSVKVAQVDYESQDSLVQALSGLDAVISNLPNHDGQATLIDASIKAGIKRFLPSEFGSNVIANAKTAALPVFAGKLATQKYLQSKEAEISWTSVITMFFFDWGLEKKFLLNIKGESVKIYDDGDALHSVTLLADIARAVVGVLKHPEETKNRAVYVQSAAISQNQLLRAAQAADPSWSPRVEQVSSEDELQRCYALLSEGGASIGSAMIGFILISGLAQGYGNDSSQKNDNELLGIKQLSEKDIGELVKRYV